MGEFGGNGRLSRIVRLLGLGAGCLALANCANSNMFSQVSPTYDVSTSARMVGPGEPAPKGGVYQVRGREDVPQDVNESAVTNDVPKLDVTKSCAATTNNRMQACLNSEQRSHDQLVKQWSDFALVDRVTCVNVQRHFAPTYTELVTCLEMARDAKSIATQQPLKTLSLVGR